MSFILGVIVGAAIVLFLWKGKEIITWIRAWREKK